MFRKFSRWWVAGVFFLHQIAAMVSRLLALHRFLRANVGPRFRVSQHFLRHHLDDIFIKGGGSSESTLSLMLRGTCGAPTLSDCSAGRGRNGCSTC